MGMIRIQDDQDNIILYLNNNELYGYRFSKDGRVEQVNKNIFNCFDMFKLSNDREILKNENGYQVILDRSTNYKHYFKNDVEDFIMFFLNNGKEEMLCAKRKNNEEKIINDVLETPKSFKKGKIKITTVLKDIALCTIVLSSLSCTASFLAPELPILRDVEKAVINQYIKTEDLDMDNFLYSLYYSKELTNEEKRYLYNEDFLEDILPYVNKSSFTKYMYSHKFKDINISSYNGELRKERGFYNLLFLNKLFVADYKKLESSKDVIAHEFIHMCQEGYGYKLITEASAELLSSEYFEGVKVDSYLNEVRLLKKLMEIIGSEPILEYNFTDNFDLIEQSVKPYLSNDEYREFLNCLTVDVSKEDKEVEEKEKRLDLILNNLYYNKYEEDIKLNKSISSLDSPWRVKYYFNKRFMNEENSYYYETEKVMPLKEAIENKIVVVYQKNIEDVTILKYDEYIEKMKDKNQVIFYQGLIPQELVIIDNYVYFRGDKVELEPFKKEDTKLLTK